MFVRDQRHSDVALQLRAHCEELRCPPVRIGQRLGVTIFPHDSSGLTYDVDVQPDEIADALRGLGTGAPGTIPDMMPDLVVGTCMDFLADPTGEPDRHQTGAAHQVYRLAGSGSKQTVYTAQGRDVAPDELTFKHDLLSDFAD